MPKTNRGASGPTLADLGEDELRREVERLNAMLDTNSDWIWEVDAQGRYTYASRHVLALLGYEPHEVLGRTPFDLMPPDEAARVGALFGAIIAQKRAFAGLINRNRHRDGHIVVLETSGVPLLGAEGNLLGYRGIDRDVTLRDAENARLHDIARRDDLTQLGNRLALRERLIAILDGAGPAAGPGAGQGAGQAGGEGRGHLVLLLDLDLFKAVNDTLGHKAGDALLAQVAARLDHATARHAARAFRLGRDEFVVVGQGDGPEDGTSVVAAVENCFLMPFDIEGTFLCISASLGVAHCGGPDTPEHVLARADQALYAAKDRRQRGPSLRV